MIMFGSNITSPADKLEKVQEEYFYHSLLHPKAQNEALLRQLRVVYTLDPKQYAKAKRSLPYIVCGIFKPEYRRRENFAYIDRFIIDIDKLSSKQMDIDEIRSRVGADPRVMMCFASPSEDGLKLMFRLKEKCYDYGMYSVFYKEFLRRFSQEYNLDQVIDRSTSDVSRACFVSMDAKATFNPECDPVDMSQYVNADDPLLFFDTKHELEAEEKEAAKEIKETKPSNPDDDVMAQIKARLGTKVPRKPEKTVFVPERLQSVLDDMKIYIEDTGMMVKDIRSIQYGKQIRAQLGMKVSEVNVFYGKKGFSVVLSTRSGTDDELNTLLADLVCQFLYQ